MDHSDMDTDILQKMVQKLNAQLELCKQQRDSYRENYHAILKTPFQERIEFKREDDQALEAQGPEI